VSLVADIAVQAGTLQVRADFTVTEGETLGILGPNGAGKTTLLRAVAGLHPLDAGFVRLDSAVLEDPSDGVRIPTEKRSIGMVFQDYALFPHLSAAGNVAFGPRSMGANPGEADRIARDWLDRVGLAAAADSRPSELSGGQSQLVALARALALEPRLLLLDEPLAAVDAGTRTGLRADLRHRLEGFAGLRLVVTHDPVDAFALADRIVVLEAGQIVQRGTIDEVAARPQSRYVADLVGVNLYRGIARHGAVAVAGGGTLAIAEDITGDVFAVVHPRAVSLHLQHPEGSPRNVWPGTVAGLERHDDRFRVRVAGTPPVIAEVTPAAVADLGLVAGRNVWTTVKATEVITYPA
jgi:molybdate transport system ATP-binding protein